MVGKVITRDFVGVGLLLIGSLIGGLIANAIRTSSAPPAASSGEARPDRIGHLSVIPSVPLAEAGDVDRKEMQTISANRETLILDARPKIFYRLGHIPSALSLPRDDFDKTYQTLQPALRLYRDKPLVVYCSGDDCEDSRLVAEALQKLGYQHVRLFRGGWSDWENAHLPEEKE